MMSAVFFIISLLPYLCLIGTIWLFTLRDNRPALFQSVISGAILWSLAIWIFTNALSLVNSIAAFPIGFFWCLYAAGLAWLIYKKREYIRKPVLPGGYFFIIYATIAITLICALAYPPNYWDVLTYHLPRVIHWLQNGNLAAYPTHIPRQIGMPPFNSMIALQSLASAGYDYFLNLAQWLAYIGIIMGTWAVTGQLGGSPVARLFAGIFAALLPAAILQASNTESSAIVTFWLLAFISLFLYWKDSPGMGTAAKLGCVLGLAILSKGSAYPIAFPFVLIMAYYCLRYPRRRFWQGCVAACLIIVINIPHWVRTYEAYGSIVGGTEKNILAKPTPGTFAVNIVYNFLNHEPLLMRGALVDLWEGMAETLGVDEKDKNIFPWGGIRNFWVRYIPEEAFSQCQVEAVLLLILFLAIIFCKFRPPFLYSCAVGGAFVLCWLFLTWHPWAGRIHLSLFIITAPLVGLFADSFKKIFWRDCLVFCLCSGAVIPLLNSSRAIGQSYFYHYHFLSHPRDTLYFNSYEQIRNAYMSCVEYLAARHPKRVGILLYDEAFEYPLWAILAKRMDKPPIVEHVFPGQENKWPEYVFVQEKGHGNMALDDIHVLKRESGKFVKVFPTNENHVSAH